MRSEHTEAQSGEAQAEQFQKALTDKGHERERIVGLYRRGRISEQQLDQELDDIDREVLDLDAELVRIRDRTRAAEARSEVVVSAEVLLQELRTRLQEPLTWELKRSVVELLVAGIQVDNIEVNGKKEARVTVRYWFKLPHSTLPVTATRAGWLQALPTGYGYPGAR